MKAASKHILFCRVVHERKTHQWPVAVFPTDQAAKQYAVFLHLAHDNGQTELAVKLDPRTIKDEAGALVKGAKWAVQEVPYAPVPDTGVANGFELDQPSAA